MKITKALGLFSIALLGLGLAVGRANANGAYGSGAEFSDPTETTGQVIFTLLNSSPYPEVNTVMNGTAGDYGSVYGGAELVAPSDFVESYFTFTDLNPSTGSGTFALGSTPGADDFLSGTFQELGLSSSISDTTTLITYAVTYTGGDLLPVIPVEGGSGIAQAGDTGTLGLTLSSYSTISGGPPTLYGFDSYGTSFSVTAGPGIITGTPEPNPAITIGIAAAGILGLVMLRKKQSSVLS